MCKFLLLVFLFIGLSSDLIAQQLPNGAKNVWDVARSGTVDEMKALMALKADTIEATNSNGFKPLLLACYRGNIKVAQFLMTVVKDIDTECQEGTSLMACVFRGDSVLAEALIKKGAKLDLVDAEGNTALILATQTNQTKMVEFLLKQGAKRERKNKDGKSALDFAMFKNNKLLIELLNH